MMRARPRRARSTLRRLPAAVASTTLALSLAGCSKLPKDPEDTLRRVEHGVLRVGIVPSDPWAGGTDAAPTGAEVELVRRLAGELESRVEWRVGDEDALFGALERFQLDLVIGGLTDATPWKKRVGVTKPYFEERVCVGTAPNDPGFDDPRGRAIAVRLGDPIAAWLSRKKAEVHAVHELSPDDAPLAAPTWQLEALQLRATSICPEERRHVMAAPPGENRWILRVERFLHAAGGGAVHDLLTQNTRERASR